MNHFDHITQYHEYVNFTVIVYNLSNMRYANLFKSKCSRLGCR